MVDDKGLILERKDGRNILSYKGKVISSTLPESNSFGLYFNGGKLEVDGAGIAASYNNARLTTDGDDIYFGDVKLTESGKCINITLANYNKLLNGELVTGYKRFDKATIYNIVADVSQASTVTYSKVDDVIHFSDSTTSEAHDNMVYLGSGLTENTIDTDDTVDETDCPFVNVKYFDPIVHVGGKIEIEYYVDTKGMDSINRGEIGDTFTVIVKTERGSTAKHTTYAGRFKIETPTFSTEGETWFSIECIDSNGVGSIVQFFDILVRDAVTPNYYTMQESDLETYGIVAGDDTPQVAYANKAALSDFFADVKSGDIDESSGYNGVVMLNRTYFIDYHATFGTQTFKRATIDTQTREITALADCTINDLITANVIKTFSVVTFPAVGDECCEDATKMQNWVNWGYVVDGCIYYVINTSTFGDNIVFPDEFTVDLNGATIKATQCDDLQQGYLVRLDNNFDTHIINGNIVGNYKGFDFLKASLNNGVQPPSEHLCVTNIFSSKYCSFEHVDISHAVGYEGGVSGNTRYNGNQFKVPTYTGSTAVDIADGDVVSKTGMVTTNLIDITGFSEIAFVRSGYCGYEMGVQREMFYSFYTSSDEYIKTIKGKQYWLCKVPSTAAKVRLSMYGTVEQFPTQTTRGSLHLYCDFAFSKNNKYISCSWHDTRSCVCNDANAKGVLHQDCTFKNIGAEAGRYEITGFLIDFEDGWQHLKDDAFINCKNFTNTRNQSQFIIHDANNFTFENNEGIFIDNRGGIESGFVENNKMPLYELDRNYASINPYVIYKGNEVGKLTVSYSEDTSLYYTQPLEKVVTMMDTTIKTTCGYEHLRMRNGVNGIYSYN